MEDPGRPSCLVINLTIVLQFVDPVTCQVHMELAKCEEDQEQIHVAIDHLHKVIIPLYGN